MVGIYTDGACSGNPGKGGFGVVVQQGNTLIHIHSCSCEETTNNREELKAIIYALDYAYKYFPNQDVIIFSDSAYCVNTCREWIYSWAKNNWQNSKKETVKNLDLMKILYFYLTSKFKTCQICKVQGHKGEVFNELADALATGNMKKYRRILNQHSEINISSTCIIKKDLI